MVELNYRHFSANGEEHTSILWEMSYYQY